MSKANLWIMPKGGSSKAGICFRCGKPVIPSKATVMEEDKDACHYHDLGVPEASISGLLVVGLDCAKSVRKLAVEEGVPNTPERRSEVLVRARAFNAKQRQQTQALMPGAPLFWCKAETLAYCDFVDQVIDEQAGNLNTLV